MSPFLEHELQTHARALVGDQLADDLVQDTALQALRERSRPASLRSWLFRSASPQIGGQGRYSAVRMSPRVRCRRVLPLLLAAACSAPVPPALQRSASIVLPERRAPAELDDADVVWTSPSVNAAGSMPIGNGEVGANVWVDAATGELCCYLARTDAFSEACRLLKLGKVRLKLEPNPFVASKPFAQRLHLVSGCIRILGGDADLAVELRLFVDAESDVVHVTGVSSQPLEVTVVGETWRTADKQLAGSELDSAWTMHGAPAGVAVRESADRRWDAGTPALPAESLAWSHHNAHSIVPATLALQGLADAAAVVTDPLLHREFGCCIQGRGRRVNGSDVAFTRAAAGQLSAANLRSFALQIAAPCTQSDRDDAWRARANDLLAVADSEVAFARTCAFWDAFWSRAWIFVDDHSDVPGRLSQAIALQRWVAACGGRGRYPIKFNGSIFTVEPEFAGGGDHDADWRKWGDCFWWQNTRLPYHAMLAFGDFECMAPLWRMYGEALPLAEARARAWHGVAGAWFPETMTIFGSYANGDYGWDRAGHASNEVQCPWWQYAWNQGPELLALMLDRQDYAEEAAFLQQQLLPMADAVLAYFSSRFVHDGKLRLSPTQAIETHWYKVEDDMPTLAGLHAVLRRLLALAPGALGERTAAWSRLQAALPPLPRRQRDGHELLAPARAYDASRQNCESPELYALFPFRLFGLLQPELELARATFAARHDRFTNGWPQDGQDAALLGLVDEAKVNLLAKLQNSNAAYRWPASWGPNFDWLPDQCHGSNLLAVAQLLLLQCEGRRIHVLPCWPKGWDVAFRLHAPGRTVVEGTWRAGKLERLVVEPAARRADVVVGTPQ